MSVIRIFRQLTRDYNLAVVKLANTKPPLKAFTGHGKMNERSSHDDGFMVEFLIYYDYRNKLRGFGYVRREDGGDIPDGHYVFVDDLGEQIHRWRKFRDKWQVGWRYRASQRS